MLMTWLQVKKCNIQTTCRPSSKLVYLFLKGTSTSIKQKRIYFAQDHSYTIKSQTSTLV